MGVMVAANWTSDFRNFAWRVAGEHYAVALFVYTTILLLLTKFLSLGLDYYSFLIEHRYHLSNQRLRGWAWDQTKGFALTFLLSQLLVQMVYLLIRLQPQWWWVTGWVLFMLLSVLLAHIAPVLLFPLFFRFRTLDDEELTARLTRMSERAGAEGSRSLRVDAFGENEEGQRRSDGPGAHPPDRNFRYAACHLQS